MTAPRPEALSVALNRSIAGHFGPGDRADAGDVVVASYTVVASYVAAVRDPIAPGVMVAEAQCLLARSVAGGVEPERRRI